MNFMNERHLYRAKRIDYGTWIVGYYTYYPTGLDGNEDTKHVIRDTSTNTGKLYFVDSSTICQCTGREDEWEHDIFQYDDERYEIQFCKDSLTWDAVSIFSSESIGLGEFSQSKYVRIGNSIDNPELLEVGK